MEKNNSAKTTYEIRKDGVIVCASTIPLCGYTQKMLRQIVATGYRYCVNGKIQRKIEESERFENLSINRTKKDPTARTALKEV